VVIVMDTSRFARYAPLTGVAFFLLALAGGISMGSSPDFADRPSEFTKYYLDDHDRVVLGGALLVMAVFFLVWFLGSVAAAARTAEGGDGRVSRLAFGGGLVGATLFLAGVSTQMMAGLRVGERNSISDDVAVVYGDLSSVLGFLAAACGFAVLLAGVALVNSRTPFLPRWLTWVSGILAIGLFEPFASWAFVLAFPVWVLVVASILFMRQASVSPAS
jgi:hypothetical protein